MLLRNCVEANSIRKSFYEAPVWFVNPFVLIVNYQKVKEILTAIKDLPSGSALRGEYAMILADPNISNLFIKNIFNCLKEVVENLEEFSDVILSFFVFYWWLTAYVVPETW